MKKETHFVGIGGIGMSALAQILLEKKIAVTGSDLTVGQVTEALKKKGASIYQGHAKDHVKEGIQVVYGSAIDEKNPEIVQAKALGNSIVHRSDLLQMLCVDTRALAVTGTHGKTTTAALLTAVLQEAGYDPTFALGGHLNQEGGINGALGSGNFFVLEADESDRTFLKYAPFGAIVTNIEPEHMENYANISDLHDAFLHFIANIKQKELFFYCGDDPLLQGLSGTSYGFGAENDCHITNYCQKGYKIVFDLAFAKENYKQICVNLIGRHNALNAAAVFAFCLRLGVPEAQIRKGLEKFCGIKRRQEITFSEKSLSFIDDYGHHPTEIKTTLAAIKEAEQDRRLITIFQPHRYSRTQDLLDEFAHAFGQTDLLYITDIYAASEEPIEGVDAHALIAKIKECTSVDVRYFTKEKMHEEIRPHDVVVTMGAGSITHYNRELVDFFAKKGPQKLKVALFFGGRSSEHMISRKSAQFVRESLAPELYETILVAIDQKGNWQMGDLAEELLTSKRQDFEGNNALSRVISALEGVDLCIPIMHGPNGEDGTIQGFFEMLQKPYTGPDFRGCAIAMDKVLTKRLLKEAGIMTPPFVSFGKNRWHKQKDVLLQEIEEKLIFPLFVKPLRLGSSLGVSKVETKEQLASAIEEAFVYDPQVLVEEGVPNCRELEFAVVGNPDGADIWVPAPGEKCAGGQFIDYQMKYGSQAVQTTLYPDLSLELVEKGRELAKRAYLAVGGSNSMRVDFLLDRAGNFWCFEVNAIPGMQPLSLFPKIFAREGVEPSALLNKLVILALARHRALGRV